MRKKTILMTCLQRWVFSYTLFCKFIWFYIKYLQTILFQSKMMRICSKSFMVKWNHFHCLKCLCIWRVHKLTLKLIEFSYFSNGEMKKHSNMCSVINTGIFFFLWKQTNKNKRLLNFLWYGKKRKRRKIQCMADPFTRKNFFSWELVKDPFDQNVLIFKVDFCVECTMYSLEKSS